MYRNETTTMVICEGCSKSFVAQRATAKYCSAGCKQEAYRNKTATVTGDVVTLPTAFESLPLDVQHTIDRISDSSEEKARRTSIALDYQAKYPNSVHKGIDYEAYA